MKHLFLSAVAVMFAFTAIAQNKAVNELAAKYADKEDFTILNVEGDLIKGFASMLGGNGTVSFDGESEQSISELCENISSAMVITSEKFNQEFAGEVERIFDSADFSPIISVSSDGDIVKISVADIKRGQHKGKKEIAIAILDKEDTIFIRIIGNIDPETVQKIMQDMA
jgi:hypothetical protein